MVRILAVFFAFVQASESCGNGGTDPADEFTHDPPGQLQPGSGEGSDDPTIYLRDMRFPLEEFPAFANSQVYGVGGSQGPAGSQCDERNYAYPWRDNFCETRTWTMPLCPLGQGHQGQDIRPATCTDALHWTVAAEDGQVFHIGSYSVWIQGDSGIRHRYLHLDHEQLAVVNGDRVAQGDRIGLVSDNFGASVTTIHLHYDIHSNGVYLPPYTTLVESYKTLLAP